MAGFQFTPIGIIPIGATAPAIGEEPAPSIIHAPPAVERIEPVYPSRGVAKALAATQAPQGPSLSASKPLTGKQLVAVARARVRELSRLLRQVPALEAERESLLRLIDAACKPAPKATVVRSIRASGT